jgi:hypothetical protein
MKTYMLSTPVDFNMIHEDELEEALTEFGCVALRLDKEVFITSDRLEALSQCAFTTDLPGAILEVTGIYDSKEETITHLL